MSSLTIFFVCTISSVLSRETRLKTTTYQPDTTTTTSKPSTTTQPTTTAKLTTTTTTTTTTTQTPNRTVLTPHGIRPYQCVIEIESGSTIIKKFGGVEVISSNKMKRSFIPSISECLNDTTNMNEVGKHNTSENLGQGWKIGATTFVAAPIESFSATYRTPGTSPKLEEQTLYYFIGLQDRTINSFNENNLTLTSPVVTFKNNKWTMNAWDCCPGGYSFHTPNIEINKGSLISTELVNNRITGNVNITMLYGNIKSNIIIKNDFRKYNWINIVGEFYNYNNCKGLNDDPFYFDNINIINKKHNKIEPQWNIFNQLESCGAQLIFNNNNDRVKMVAQFD